MKYRLLAPEEILRVGDELLQYRKGEPRLVAAGQEGFFPEVWMKTNCVWLPVKYAGRYRRPLL